MRDIINLTAPETGDREVEIASIMVPDRLRLIDRAYVESIRVTLAEVGLMQPISLSILPGSNSMLLVDGEHRLQAAKAAGWTTIKAIIRDLTPDEREKHEIYANLIRNELNALDRIVFVGRLAEIFERDHPEARNGGDRKTKKFLEKNQLANIANWSAFNGEAARRTGLGDKSIRNARQLFEALGPEVIAAIRGTALVDNGAQLRALADVEPEHRLLVAQEIAAGAPNVARAKHKAGIGEVYIDDPDQRALRAFLAIWTRCSSKSRKMIRAEIDKYEQPVPASKKRRG